MSTNKKLYSEQINNNFKIIAEEKKENVSCFLSSPYCLTNIKAMNNKPAEKLDGFLFNFHALLNTINEKKNFRLLIPTILNLFDGDGDDDNDDDDVKHWILIGVNVSFSNDRICLHCKKNYALFEIYDSLNLGLDELKETNINNNEMEFQEFLVLLNNKTNLDVCSCQSPIFVTVKSTDKQIDGTSCGYFMLKYAENLMRNDDALVWEHNSQVLTNDFRKLVLLRHNQLVLKKDYSSLILKLDLMNDTQIQLKKDYSTLNSRINATQQIPNVVNIESDETIKTLYKQIHDLSKENISLNEKISEQQLSTNISSTPILENTPRFFDILN